MLGNLGVGSGVMARVFTQEFSDATHGRVNLEGAVLIQDAKAVQTAHIRFACETTPITQPRGAGKISLLDNIVAHDSLGSSIPSNWFPPRF